MVVFGLLLRQISFKSSCRKGAILPNFCVHAKFRVLVFSCFPLSAEIKFAFQVFLIPFVEANHH